MKPQATTVTIATPRGVNIGNNIKNDLVNQGIFNHINLNEIITVRNTKLRCAITTVKYSFK